VRCLKNGSWGILSVLLIGLGAATAIAQPTQPLRPETPCPASLDTLVAGLLRDLPSYANRVARRSTDRGERTDNDGTFLIAGRAELQPLDIRDRRFQDPLASADSPENLRQVFFTTLERHYHDSAVVQVQQYHWLFLTQAAATDTDTAAADWRMAFMFSRTAVATSRRPPTPPQVSSDGIVGQAVRIWLRDCRAGDIYPIEADPSEPTG